jgi:predicted MPP superfamily phosphohydrolase
LDRELCSADFLRRLVQIRAEDPGLILQLEDAPEEIFSLTDVFPAFRTALARSTEWPGILLWTVQGDSSFLPLPTESPRELERAAHWIFSHLATTIGVDLELFTSQYFGEFRRIPRSSAKRFQILQVSDIHIGCPEASKRLPRVQQLIRNLADDLGDDSRIIPVVTGDLMDSPDEANLDSVRAFLDFLTNLGSEAPIVVLGNHDVRKDGYLGESLRQATRLPATNGRVIWLEDEKVGLICFNSVTEGRLARGMLGEHQLLDVGSEIDRKRSWREYSLVSVLHHHPIPVERPDWYVQPFYERVLGRTFETTESLEDASAFLAFTESRRVSAILHGHKHIPRADKTAADIPVFGCGSTVGKVPTSDGRPYMSINVITIDPANRKLSGRLLAERIPGGGLKEEKRHEVLARSELRTTE